MLPFLKPKPVNNGGIMTQLRPSDEGKEPKEDSGLRACAADLIRAMHDKDEEHVALALRAAFDLMESEPHPEGPHTNEESESE